MLGQIFFLSIMAVICRFALCLCVLLLVSRSPSLASGDTDHSSTSSSEHANTSSSGQDGHTEHDGGHGGGPITTLPIVSWKWHHVETPYLVALWILVCWLCKIGECQTSLSSISGVASKTTEIS